MIFVIKGGLKNHFSCSCIHAFGQEMSLFYRQSIENKPRHIHPSVMPRAGDAHISLTVRALRINALSSEYFCRLFQVLCLVIDLKAIYVVGTFRSKHTGTLFCILQFCYRFVNQLLHFVNYQDGVCLCFI